MIEHLPVAPGPYESCVVSPDGTMATVVRTTSPTASDLWVLDLRRGSMSRLTRSPGRVDRAVWSPDGTRIAFSSNRTGRWDIYEIRSDGTGAESPIVVSGSLLKYPNGYTPDGRELLFEQIGERSGWDVWTVPLEGDRTPRPLLATPSDEQYASVSHDGRWLLFSSNESGRPEIYVQGYPVPGRRHMITTTGGSIPRWRSDDREILFLASSSVGYVTVDPDAGFATGTPEVHPFSREITGGDAAPSFARLLGIVRVAGGGDQEALTLVVNWRSELGRR